jgi:hypothetical protein
MAEDPWKDTDPRPGYFDAFLESIDADDPSVVERHAGSAEARLTRVVRVSGEDAARLDAPAAARGQEPAEVVAELVRNA